MLQSLNHDTVAATPATLHLRLLGNFSLLSGDEPVTGINTPRLQSLFSYLALHRDMPQLRQHLAFLFWPDSKETQARNNLRQLLHTLRGAVPSLDTYLLANNSAIWWHVDAPIQLDVNEFEQALTLAEAAEHRNEHSLILAALERAAALYQGDLLPSCYEPWIMPERERLRQRYLQTLSHLVRLLEAQHDYTQAISYTQKIILHDELNEDAYCALMRLFSGSGDRAGVVRVYHDCLAVLQRELGIEASPATQETYEHLLKNSAPMNGPPVAHSGPSSLIGRHAAWGKIQGAWSRACTSGPEFVLVTGEAGIGKSRLTEELLLWVRSHGYVTAKTRSYAAEGRLSLAPVTDWLCSEGLRPYLGHLDAIWLAEVARILPELLSEYPDLPQCEPMSEYGQRQRFFQALAKGVLTAPQPLLLVIDDLQWCDQETLEWLHFLLRFDLSSRLLIVGTARTEELQPQHALQTLLVDLRTTMGVTEIVLEPLDAAETAELAARLTKGDLGIDAAMRLYRETEGNPLFVIETVRAGLERLSQSNIDDHLSGSIRDIPPKVQAVIAGRLAQLSAPARELVALSAAMGRAFGLDGLARASGTDEEQVARTLDELWQRRIIREQSTNRYDFTHDKLREVAYAEISAPQRRLLHRRIAQSLEAIYADDLDAVSSQIAAHYDRAGQAERAIPYYQRAAVVSRRVYANEDAISLLSRALALLDQLPGGTKRDVQELVLLLDLGPIYRITRGWTAPELEILVDRTLALCDTVGDDTQRASALYGQQSMLVVQAKLEKVQLVADELQALYQRVQGSAPPLSRMMLAGARMQLGRLREANEAFELIITDRSSTRNQQLQESQGWNFEIHTRAWQSHALWCLGYPDRAIRCGQDAIRLASDLAQPFNQALASTYFAMLQQMCADVEPAREHAEAALAFTIEHKAPYYQTWSEILTSYALAREQRDAGSLDRLRQCISRLKESGARLRLPYYLWLLARLYGQIGSIDVGLAVIEEALAESRANNERWWDSELHRLRSELLLANGVDDYDVEVALLRAAEIARAQHAKSLELRAAMTLARHWRDRNRADEARHLLSDIYSWFTEGFDTPDLQSARSLLTSLI